MAYHLSRLGADHPLLSDAPAARQAFLEAIDDLLGPRAAFYRRLWAYYRNPMRVGAPGAGESDRPYRQAQEWGLPARITGHHAGREPFLELLADASRKEVVVENDIGWRIDTHVDFLFGKSLTLDSAAPDPDRARLIAELLRQVLASHGGLAFLQRMALVGAVCGSVDVLVWLDKTASSEAPAATANLGGGAPDEPPAQGDPTIARLASRIRLELIEPARALPLIMPGDAEDLRAYAQVWQIPHLANGREAPAEPGTSRSDWLRKLLGAARFPITTPQKRTIVRITTPKRWHLYHDARLIDSGTNPLGLIPLVHVQNIARPFEYEGAGDVEPLIPLQDELNTRLSDRANRLALQSMKMYLGIGIEGFADEPVQPGRMWSTENPDARILEFGGEAPSPGEEAAIRDIREALDKASGVSPVAAGTLRNRLGHLTSAVALRITFQSLLARIERKRANYGAGLERICELALLWLDRAGLFSTTPAERRIRIAWADPIPASYTEQLEQARLKQSLGVEPAQVLRELGYGERVASSE